MIPIQKTIVPHITKALSQDVLKLVHLIDLRQIVGQIALDAGLKFNEKGQDHISFTMKMIPDIAFTHPQVLCNVGLRHLRLSMFIKQGSSCLQDEIARLSALLASRS